MQLSNSTQSWGWLTILIHWFSALAVFGLFGLGVYMVELTYYDAGYRELPTLHKSIGLLLLALTGARIIWRFRSPGPRPLRQARWQVVAAHTGHGLLYLLLCVVMISGYLISTADGRGIALFGSSIVVPALVQGLPEQADIAGKIHWAAAWSLVVLAGGHALLALIHHLWHRDATLKRMLKPH